MGVWVVATPFPFGDVNVDGAHAPGIGCLESLDIVDGYSSERYDEQSGVARAQTASIVARTLGLDTTTGSTFPDMTDGAHSGAATAWAADGILEGDADGNFDPWSTLSRGQAASVLAAAAGREASGVTPYGDTIGSVHEQGIVALTEAGIIRGFEDGTFRASEPVTRGQFASMVAQLLPLLEDTDA